MKRLVIALLLVCAITVMAQQPQTTNKWEYKFEHKVSEKRANELAAQGWELTAIGNEAEGVMASIPFMVFKRPVL